MPSSINENQFHLAKQDPEVQFLKVSQKAPSAVITTPGPALAAYIRNENPFVIARSASDEAISAAVYLAR